METYLHVCVKYIKIYNYISPPPKRLCRFSEMPSQPCASDVFNSPLKYEFSSAPEVETTFLSTCNCLPAPVPVTQRHLRLVRGVLFQSMGRVWGCWGVGELFIYLIW